MRDLRAALEAFLLAYGSQDSHTKGLDNAAELAKSALAASPHPKLIKRLKKLRASFAFGADEEAASVISEAIDALGPVSSQEGTSKGE